MAPTLNYGQTFIVEEVMPMYMGGMIGDQDDPLLAAFPLEYQDRKNVIWDIRENGYGLTALSALNKPPETYILPGIKRYAVPPGYYREQCIAVDEEMMLAAAGPGTIEEPLEIADQLDWAMLYTGGRIYQRFRQTLGNFLGTGTFTNTSAQGLKHTDTIQNYQSVSPVVAWVASKTTAIPISDLLGWQATYRVGQDTSFGTDSVLLCNPQTIVDLFNTNQIQTVLKDRFGATFLPQGDSNELLVEAEGRFNELMLPAALPKIKVDLGGYYATLAAAQAADVTQFTHSIPSSTMIWIGKRANNQLVGKTALARNHGSCQIPGEFSSAGPDKKLEIAKTIARGLWVKMHLHDRLPRRWELEVSFAMAPIVYYPSAIIGITYS